MPETNKKKMKRLKLLIGASISSFLFIFSVCILLFSFLTMDKTKLDYQKSENELSEIIKKNYIKAFKNHGNSGIFSFSLDEEDINDLFERNNELLSSEYVKKINYKRNGTHHYFYFELNKKILGRKRLVFDTIPSVSVNQDYSTNLKIVSCTVGRLNATPFLKHKIILDESLFTYECLPIKYDSNKNCFVVSPLKFMDYFPKSYYSDFFFDLAKTDMDLFSFNAEKNLFGFDISFDNLSPYQPIIDQKTTAEFDFYNDLKTACEGVNFSSLSAGEHYKCYSVSSEDLSALFTKCLPTDKKETIRSPLTDEEVFFDLVTILVSFERNNNINLGIIYSIDGYLFKITQEAEFLDYSGLYFSSTIDLKPKIIMQGATFEGKDNKFVNFINDDIVGLYQNVSNYQSNFFTYDDEKKCILTNLKTMNDSFADYDLKYSTKNIEINDSEGKMNFILTKSS